MSKIITANNNSTGTGNSILRENHGAISSAMHVIKADWPVYRLIVAVWIFGYLYLLFTGHLQSSNLLMYVQVLMPLLTLMLLLLHLGKKVKTGVLQYKSDRAIRLDTAESSNNAGTLISSLAMFFMVCLFMGVFTAVKGSLGLRYGFLHDVWQADLDRFLFLSHDPWQILFKPLHFIPLQAFIE